MKIIFTVLGYLRWHYSKAILSFTDIWKNLLFFITDFFSIKLLLRNFFDPWKKMTDSYPKRFNFKDYLFSFITNSITRVVGIIMRFILLIAGFLACGLFCLLLPIGLIIWIILPLVVIFLIGNGLILIAK
jgi:hypothetical protein